LLPQNFIGALSEVFLWVANISFAYTEAPKSMKSVVSAMVYLSITGGSLIIFFVTGIKFFESQVKEFLFFACLMFIVTIIFVILAMRYKYRAKCDDEA
jgi:dipeptide/tripeptide permease